MKIAMIGSGYVGLVSGACFSEFGFSVTCVDLDEDKVARLQQNEIPIYEPGLQHLVEANSAQGRLQFTADLKSAVAEADVVFIAVGTPGRRGDGAVDMAYVDQAAKDIAGALDGFTVVVTKSTVPVGTARRLEGLICEANPDAEFATAANPEFLREGSAIEDFMRPDRVIIGVDEPRARKKMQALYRPLYLRNAPVIFTSFETAELIKYATNAFLATRISFVNELADLCEAVDANITEVADALGRDGRIGPKYLHTGPSYGGSCFPKDTRALAAIGREEDVVMRIVEATIEVNELRKQRMTDKIRDCLGGDVNGKRIAVLGISFKPNTDDIREAPSLSIIPALQTEGAEIRAHDPVAMEAAKGAFSDVTWCDSPLEAAQDADGVVILTEWNVYRGLDLEALALAMRIPVMIDLRNIFTLEEMAARPFHYHSLGRPVVIPQK
ncbi:MAG: UDP-glucose dehydrogenase family protein [Hyphomicrobiales bacterium]